MRIVNPNHLEHLKLLKKYDSRVQGINYFELFDIFIIT
jgi:hypothetical protein